MTSQNPDAPRPLPLDHPHLQEARARLRRARWAWAALSFALGALSLAASFRTGGQAQLAISGVPWLLTAAFLALSEQPLLLALIATQLAFSLSLLLPGAAEAFGADPVALIFGASGVEAALFALIRGGFALAAWSQFLFYRMLYGTAAASGLDPRLPPVPEVVPNRSDAFATGGLAVGAIALLVVVAALALRETALAPAALAAAHSAAIYAIGLGVGSAFSSTSRRAAALTGIFMGGLAFSASVAVGRFIVG